MFHSKKSTLSTSRVVSDRSDPHEIRIRPLQRGSWDMGKFNVALNPIFEFVRGEEGEKEWEFESGYAAGIRYHAGRLLNIGLEAKGSADGHYLGPVIAHGRHDLWMALGSAFKISDIEDGKPEFQIRLLLGVGLSRGE